MDMKNFKKFICLLIFMKFLRGYYNGKFQIKIKTSWNEKYNKWSEIYQILYYKEELDHFYQYPNFILL